MLEGSGIGGWIVRVVEMARVIFLLLVWGPVLEALAEKIVEEGELERVIF